MNKINVNEIETKRELLVENEKYKTLFFKFEPTKGLPNHTHDGYASIQVIDGIIDMNFTHGQAYELKKGDFLAFDARDEHMLPISVKNLYTICIY